MIIINRVTITASLEEDDVIDNPKGAFLSAFEGCLLDKFLESKGFVLDECNYEGKDGKNHTVLVEFCNNEDI